jgi:hypothetical protein
MLDWNRSSAATASALDALLRPGRVRRLSTEFGVEIPLRTIGPFGVPSPGLPTASLDAQILPPTARRSPSSVVHRQRCRPLRLRRLAREGPSDDLVTNCSTPRSTNPTARAAWPHPRRDRRLRSECRGRRDGDAPHRLHQPAEEARPRPTSPPRRRPRAHRRRSRRSPAPRIALLRPGPVRGPRRRGVQDRPKGSTMLLLTVPRTATSAATDPDPSTSARDRPAPPSATGPLCLGAAGQLEGGSRWRSCGGGSWTRIERRRMAHTAGVRG